MNPRDSVVRFNRFGSVRFRFPLNAGSADAVAGVAIPPLAAGCRRTANAAGKLASGLQVDCLSLCLHCLVCRVTQASLKAAGRFVIVSASE